MAAKQDPTQVPVPDDLRPDYAAPTGPLAAAVAEHEAVVAAGPQSVNPRQAAGRAGRPLRAGHQQPNAAPTDANPWPRGHGSLAPGDVGGGSEDYINAGHARQSPGNTHGAPKPVETAPFDTSAPSATKADTPVGRVLEQGRERGWV